MRQSRTIRTAAGVVVVAAILACGGSVQAQSALPVQATLDVAVISRAGEVMAVPMRIWNSGPGTAQHVKVTVISPAGTSPPAPLLGPSLPIVVGTLGPCPSPCPAPRVVPLQFDVTGIPDGTVVRWSIKGTFDDGTGHQWSFGTVRLATVPAAGGQDPDDAAIQAVWKAFKDAIRRGDDAAAKAQFSQDPDPQAYISELLANLTPADRANIDAIFPPIYFWTSYGDRQVALFAEYLADKVTAGVLEAHSVTFVLDQAGWHIYGF